MSTQRKQYSAEFKARVALEALKGLKTVNEFASTYGVHPTQIAQWTHRLQQEIPAIVSARRAQPEHDQEAVQAPLYQHIGPRKVAWDWVKKLDVSRVSFGKGKRMLVKGGRFNAKYNITVPLTEPA